MIELRIIAGIVLVLNVITWAIASGQIPAPGYAFLHWTCMAALSASLVADWPITE